MTKIVRSEFSPLFSSFDLRSRSDTFGVIVTCFAGLLVKKHPTNRHSLYETPPPMKPHPLILTLDQYGSPHRWVNWQHACVYVARGQVAWDAGDTDFTFVGGINRVSGERSTLRTSSIIAIRGRALAGNLMHAVPPLSNRELFHRDRHICAYCAQELASQRLTRDHVSPVSQGGKDTWMNVVTACRPCNQRKSGRTPEQARMQLVYAPYVPNKAEYLILCNRQILADQMDFLARHVPSQRRHHFEVS